MELKINTSQPTLSELTFDDIAEPEYDDHGACKWIVSVDIGGYVSILKHPNIHESFIESCHAEDCGLPPDVIDTDPGVYEWTCRLVQHRDWESGQIDDFEFEIVEERLLFGQVK